MSKLHDDHFKMKDIGKGIWFSWWSVYSACSNKYDIINLYEHILMFNSRIRCKECSIHSNDYVVDTSDYMNSKLSDSTLTDSEIIQLFAEWLHEYQNTANSNSGKDPSTFPNLEDVLEYYNNFKFCESGCSGPH